MSLIINQLSAGYNHHQVLKGINAEFQQGQVIVLIGPNGCGKSTLLKCIAQIHPYDQGEVIWEKNQLNILSKKLLAKQLALLPQHVTAPNGMTVEQLVRFGRFPHQGWFKRLNIEDQKAIDDALSATHLSELKNQNLSNLSGGQRQRAWIAMVLAQQTPLILLDEPISMLDIGHQADILNLVRSLASQGKTIVMVLHELATAARCADFLVAMKDGQIIAQGKSEDVLTKQLVHQLYNLDAEVRLVEDDQHKKRLLVIPNKFGD
ncbi:ABC transporter ATP-binding protein [Acinetobacter sp. DSM 11652]|uniref:ABC transporter ATP-binding protein n=1 Tax=Acinetobacter sp. DSM 11652 TaxID=346222 RepID=UPI0008B20E23|nr:ABC transporter ATP-binding protein [Acinetobacter sp. DSM 11652]SEL21894.1 iron complex transport system ATP-binding protein [Acinetobacter sp. DSM 11652]